MIMSGWDTGLFLWWGLALVVYVVWAYVDQELHPRR